jgi:DNA-binding transcriptional LysR family regulator
MRYTLRQLEVFAGVGQFGGVSKAADHLNMSQSAASAALAELERQFERPLFDRHGKRLQLNETGKLVLPKALELLERAAELESLFAGKAVGAIRVGATLTIGNYLATMLIAEFMRRYPDSRPTLEVGNTTHIARSVAAFELDLGLIEGEYRDPDLEMTDWVADELAVFCAPEHRLARRRKVTVDELLHEWWIVREPGSGTRQTLDRAMASYLSRWQIRLELGHTEGIKRAVEAGLGIGCVSRLALVEAFRRGSLVELKAPELDLRRRFYFLLHRQKYLTPGIRAFLELCREASVGAKRSDQIGL